MQEGKFKITKEELLKLDKLAQEAMKFIVICRSTDSTCLQYTLGIGYPRAMRLIDIFENVGFITPADSLTGVRETNMTLSEFEEFFGEKVEHYEVKPEVGKRLNKAQQVKLLRLDHIDFLNENGEMIEGEQLEKVSSMFGWCFSDPANLDSTIAVDFEDMQKFLKGKKYKLRYQEFTIKTPNQFKNAIKKTKSSSLLCILDGLVGDIIEIMKLDKLPTQEIMLVMKVNPHNEKLKLRAFY